MTGPHRRAAVSLVLFLVAVAAPRATLHGQEIRGRLVDTANGDPVGLAGVFLLDSARAVVARAASDSAGFYSVEAPSPGEYYLFVQRLGYFDSESPLLRVEADASYGLDMEMRPEPFRLDPLDVAIRNEELEDYLTLEFGVNPNSVLGYRSYQGIRVQEARLLAVDNTDFLRHLHIPVSHGVEVCVGAIGMAHPDRTAGSASGERQCGVLVVDGYLMPNEHIEELDLDQIAVVVVVPGQVRLYTRNFDWTFRPGGGEGEPVLR